MLCPFRATWSHLQTTTIRVLCHIQAAAKVGRGSLHNTRTTTSFDSSTDGCDLVLHLGLKLADSSSGDLVPICIPSLNQSSGTATGELRINPANQLPIDYSISMYPGINKEGNQLSPSS